MALTTEQVTDFHIRRNQGAASAVIALSGGEWSQAFAFEVDGQSFVSRFNPSNEDFLMDEYANRFCSPSLPIPRVLEVGNAFGGYYAISERSPGVMLDDLDGPSLELTLPSLHLVMDAMREADISDSTGFGLWDSSGNGTSESWSDFLLSVSDDDPSTRIAGWSDILKSSPVGDSAFHEAYEALADLATSLPEDRSLIHNDLMHRNVLTENHHITAVFDWGFAMYGDHLYDIAGFIFSEPLRRPADSIDWEASARHHFEEIGLEVIDYARRLKGCLLHIGLEAQTYYSSIRDWPELAKVARRTVEIARTA